MRAAMLLFLAVGLQQVHAQLPQESPAGATSVLHVQVTRKQALIIGNATYTTAPLKSPVDDAIEMEKTVRGLGFEVEVLRNLDLEQMRTAIDRFTSNLSDGSLALFYFAGHGVQVDSVNYLLPVNFQATSEADVKTKAYPAMLVQQKMEERARLRVLILDACRNNPFRYARDLREATGGLAPMSAGAEGTLIAFATGDNNTAEDADSYTKYLIPVLLTPGIELREIFQRTKEDVYVASQGKQNPSIYENIIGRYYFIAPEPTSRPLDYRGYPISNSKDPSLGKTGGVSPPAGGTPKRARDGQIYMWIPSGTFSMGCSNGDRCYDDEVPIHTVTLTKGFWLGQTEVTEASFSHKGASRMPVQVSWNLARGFCESLGMHLPTEAEWEYAARGGGTANNDLDTLAWFGLNSMGHVHEVSSKTPNEYGLFDMLGNVWEWVADWYGPYNRAPQRDPHGPPDGSASVVRGGAYNSDSWLVRVSQRNRYSRDASAGFRCAADSL